MSKNDLGTFLAGILSGAGRSLGEELKRVVGPATGGWLPGSDQLVSYLGELRVLQQGQSAAVATNTRAVLQNTAAQVSSGSGSTLASVGKAVWSKLGAGEFGALPQGQSAAVATNTRAVLQNTAAQVSSGSGSTLASVGKAVWSKLGAGLTLSPLITGLVRLFSGGSPEPPPALITYTRPPAMQFEGAVARSWGPQVYPLGYDQYGRPRAMGDEERRAEDAGRRPAPQITIQVQAIDSRSFLDHSAEIAQAVREAMLNSHALNDVVSELYY